MRSLASGEYGISAVAISPDGQLLATVHTEGHFSDAVQRRRVSDATVVWTLRGHQDGVNAVAFSPDGQFLISGAGDIDSEGVRRPQDTTVRLWRVRDGGLVRTFTGHRDIAVSVAVSPDGRTIASASRDGVIRFWAMPQGAGAGRRDQGRGDGPVPRGPAWLGAHRER